MSDSSYGSVYVEGVTYIDEREIAKRDAEIERLLQGERAADAEIERLREQVTQRGARMQVMREWMDSGVELMGAGAWPVWYGFLEDHPEAAEWFDEEGVPK